MIYTLLKATSAELRNRHKGPRNGDIWHR